MTALRALLLLALAAAAHAADDASTDAPLVPSPRPLAAFAPVWEESPFTRPLDPAAAWVLAGVARMAGTTWVTLHNKTTGERFLVSETPNAKGWQLLSLQPATSPREVTARVLINGENIPVRYEKEQLDPKNLAKTAGPAAAQRPASPAPSATPAPRNRRAAERTNNPTRNKARNGSPANP